MSEEEQIVSNNRKRKRSESSGDNWEMLDDDYNGIPIDFNNSEIWERLATELAHLVYDDKPLAHFDVKERAKKLRVAFRKRDDFRDDRLNKAFGHCSNCGRVPDFVNFNGTKQAISSLSRKSKSKSRASTSNTQPSPTSNAGILSSRINDLIEREYITADEGLLAIKWVNKDSLQCDVLAKMSDIRLANALKSGGWH